MGTGVLTPDPLQGPNIRLSNFCFNIGYLGEGSGILEGLREWHVGEKKKRRFKGHDQWTLKESRDIPTLRKNFKRTMTVCAASLS